MRNFLKALAGLLFSVFLGSCSTSLEVTTIPENEPVIRAIEKMPRRGGYSTGVKANAALSQSIQLTRFGLRSAPRRAKPSYCSGATYLALLNMIKEAEGRGEFRLTRVEAEKLLVRGQADGVGVWGRWNANGPGAAKLVHDLGLGMNFEDYSKAQPGDFMKIFWTKEIGKHEFGHLVIYLGTYLQGGQEYVRFWSSNQPSGYGVKSVPKSAVKWAIFTRVTNLEKIKNVDGLSRGDRFLSRMLTRRYSRSQVRRACKIH